MAAKVTSSAPTPARVSQLGIYQGQNQVPGPEASAYQREQDAWQRSMETAIGLAIGQYLTTAKLLKRRVEDLDLAHLEGMGVAACAEYVYQREARRAQERDQEMPLLPLSDWEKASTA